MKFFKRPLVAIILSLLLIIISTSVSITSDLDKKLSEIEDVFYHGLNSDGIEEPGIHGQLLELCRIAEGLIIYADNENLDDQGLVDARLNLEYELQYADIYISWVYDAYYELMMSISAFEKSLGPEELADISGLLESAALVKKSIDSSSYNDFRTNYMKNFGLLEKFFIDFYDLDIPDYFI